VVVAVVVVVVAAVHWLDWIVVDLLKMMMKLTEVGVGVGVVRRKLRRKKQVLGIYTSEKSQ
jgi:hypothetical protein